MGAKWYTLKGENVKKCIKVGTAVLKNSFGEVNCHFYGCKSRFTALLIAGKQNLQS